MDQPPISELSRPRFDPLSTGSSATNNYSKDVSTSKSTPWCRTTKGRTIIAVGAFIVVAVIVGVAVGVTQSKNNGPADSGPVRGLNEVTTAATTATTATTTMTAVITQISITTTIGAAIGAATRPISSYLSNASYRPPDSGPVASALYRKDRSHNAE